MNQYWLAVFKEKQEMQFTENEELAQSWLEQAKVRLERAAELGSEAAKAALKAMGTPAVIALGPEDKTPAPKDLKKK